MTVCEKITNAFDVASKICAVMTAAAIVLSTAATNVLFVSTVVFSLAAGNWREKFNQIIRNPVAIMFLLFYAMFLVGTLYTTAPWPDVLLMLRKYSRFLLAVFFIPLFAQERWRNYAVNAFMAAILVMLATSYLRDFGWMNFYAKNGVVEVFKVSIEFNFLMAFAAYLCLVKITSADSRYRWLKIVFLFIVYTILFRSTGRSGYFVFAALVGLFFFQKLGWRGLLMAIVGVGILAGLAFAFSPTFKDRTNAMFSDIQTYEQNERTSVGLRMSFVKNSINVIKKNPIFGAGTGSFEKEYDFVHLGTPSATGNPHNEYVFICVQFGIFGLLMLLLVFGVPLWYSRFLPEEQKYIARGAVIAIAVGCLANSWLLDTTEGHFYVYFIVLTFAALRCQVWTKDKTKAGNHLT